MDAKTGHAASQTSKIPITAIVAMTPTRGIGQNGGIPWPKLKKDMFFFKTTTTGSGNNCNAVIMGRKTWSSLPKTQQPLPNRFNVVLSTNAKLREQKNIAQNVLIFPSFEMAIHHLNGMDTIQHIYAIGGERVYEEALKHPQCQNIFVTQLLKEYQCDTHFPPLPKNQHWEVKDEGPVFQQDDIHYVIKTFTKKEE
jgi:dihydrofolate reductase